MTCKDCLHYDLCVYFLRTSGFSETTIEASTNVCVEKSQCEHFADKTLCVKLPCKVEGNSVLGTARYMFEDWNAVTGVPGKNTSWYYEIEGIIDDAVRLAFGAGYLAREEAEAALKECEA